MSDDSTAPADLSNIGIDLTQMFRPAWTTETTDTSARLAAKFDEGDRPERRGGDRGRDHGAGRDSRGPRPERGAGSPRPEGRREGPGQGGRSGGPRREGRSEGRPGGRDRNDRGGSRGREERRPEPVAKTLLEGWKLQLVPEAPAIEGIAKQIRSRAKAYPLFELARLIVQLSDRYSVKLEAVPEKATELFRAKLDDSLWTSRKEAVNHLLAKHLGKFYRSTSVTTEAPKGAFAVVAQCGMSGVLLGPPNHHEYTSKVIALHSSRFKNMPFEVYKSRIRMMRDEALIEQWKTEQSTKTIYIPLTPSEAEGEVVTQAEVPLTAEVSTPEVSNQEVVESVVAEDLPTEASAQESAEPAQANEETAPSDAPAADTDTQTDTRSEAEPASGGSETPSEKVNEKIEEGFTLQQATAHFLEHHAANEVEPLGKEITLEGRVALHGSTPLLRELLLKNLQEMDRFPLPLAQVVGKELTNRGLQLFKSHKKIINVSVARPRYLDRETSAIGDGFRSILEYLEAHPKQHRDKQWAALLALRTETVETPATEAPAAPAAIEATGVTEGATVKNAATAPDEETLKKREQALGADLLWLLHQGHVIDFAMGNLQAATRPAPKQLSKKEAAAAAAAAGATTATGAEGEFMESAESIEGVEGIEGATEDSEEEIVISEEAPASTSSSAAIEPSSEATPAAEPLPESLEPVQE